MLETLNNNSIKINPRALNSIVLSDDDSTRHFIESGTSVAYWLAVYCTPLLAVCNFELGLKINEEALNYNCGIPDSCNFYNGMSTVFSLVCTDVGLTLLSVNDCELGLQISRYCLNITNPFEDIFSPGDLFNDAIGYDYVIDNVFPGEKV